MNHRFSAISALFFLVHVIITASLRTSPFRVSRKATSTLLKSSVNGGEEDFKKSLWSERVEYVDLSASVAQEPSPTSRSLPLFLLGAAFYPQGVTYLNVFEMKYRTMMFDCANSDDMFGYIHTDNNGRIACVGTLCKIVDRQLLEDGRQFITVEGVRRFRVNKILKTLPYVLAEVETFENDDEPEDDGAVAKLEGEVYDALKYYVRLMKSYEPNKGMVISQAAKRNRPSPANIRALTASGVDNKTRRTNFSFSLANMIQMTQPKESQLLLQTRSATKRLKAEKEILLQASELIAEQLIKMEVLTADARDSLKYKSLSTDADDDILPPDVIDQAKDEEKDEWDLSNVM